MQLPQRGQQTYWDTKLPTFGLRVSQGGSKTFILKYQNAFITLGRFPIIGLADARAEAKRLLAEFTLGRMRPQSLTYQAAVQLFLEDKGKNRRDRTVKDYKRLLNRLGFVGRVSDINGREVERQLKRFKSEGEYNHLLVALRIFFNWCLKRSYTTTNPTVALSTYARPPRARVLSDAELQCIWRACQQREGASTPNGLVPKDVSAPSLPAHFATIVQLLILTGQRCGEIASLQTSWIKDDTITLPALVAKNGREHIFPVGQLATELLKNHLTRLSLSETSLLFPARGRTSPFNGWSKSKASLDAFIGLTDWTLHDLRRTFATRLSELGVAPHVIERLLNHISGQISGVAAIYNRNKMMPEMRAAISLWETHLQAVIAPQQSKAA